MLDGLRLAVCGSAQLSPALAGRLPAVLGRLPLVRYGTTETGLNVSNIYQEPRGDTIGVPLPGVMARIWSRGAELAAGQDGEIQLRGPQVFGGYWNDPAATAAAFTQDGWFRTGDIGRVDPANGQLAIRGRIKEMIITGGLNVYPHEVEIVLESHPSVAEAAVSGVPHSHWGEQVTAWVVMRPGCDFDQNALIAHARTRAGRLQVPQAGVRAGGPAPQSHRQGRPQRPPPPVIRDLARVAPQANQGITGRDHGAQAVPCRVAGRRGDAFRRSDIWYTILPKPG